MGRNKAEGRTGLVRLKNAAQAVKRIFTGGRSTPAAEATGSAPRMPQRTAHVSAGTARPARREADIPLDVLDRAYTPPVTSSKASFRSDGADHQLDQEFATGVADDRWNDEDHFTNKSGDPRIGTRRRTYEPAEERAGSRD